MNGYPRFAWVDILRFQHIGIIYAKLFRFTPKDFGCLPKVHFTGKYRDIFTTPTKTQRLVFDLPGIKYVYKGEPQNDDYNYPQILDNKYH